MKRIAFVVATPLTADAFLRGHILALSELYEVDLISNYPDGYESSLAVCNLIHAPIERDIHIWRDIVALCSLIKIFSRQHYDAVHSVTPKAGLLAMTAAWLARVPVRHHTYTGQVWATRTGISRRFLRFLDRLIFSFSTRTLVDSISQRDFLIAEKVVKPERSMVLAGGSISGVNTNQFKPDPCKRALIRSQYDLKDENFVFLFLGRINSEKGVPELIAAFRIVLSKFSQVRLMIVGPDESGAFDDESIVSSFGGALIRVGFTREPQAYFNAADIFCLPSHREGFGSVIIEAAACGIASIASNIYGISDAVFDGKTGLLHVAKSVDDLTHKMMMVASDSSLKDALAKAAMERARNEFSAEVVEQALVGFYRDAFFDDRRREDEKSY